MSPYDFLYSKKQLKEAISQTKNYMDSVFIIGNPYSMKAYWREEQRIKELQTAKPKTK